MALTKVTGQVVSNTTDVTVGVLTVSGISTFTGRVAIGTDLRVEGSVSVGGTITYEDVTNIDAVGLVTARNGIVVGSGITLSKDGDGFFTGVVTATSYNGDGSNLTGIDLSAVTGATGDFSIADKIVHTGDTNTALRFPAADTVTVETGGSEAIRVDSGGRLLIGTATTKSAGSGQYANLNVEGYAGGTECFMSLSRAEAASAMSADDEVANLTFNDSAGYEFARIQVLADAATGATDTPGRLVFKTTADGASSSSERLRITKDGAIGIAGANYGTSGQVLQSQGSGSAVQWASVGGMTLLSSATLSSSGTTAANITFSTTGYEYLYGKLYGVTRPSSANISDYGLRWNGTSSNVHKYVMQRMDNNGSISTYGNNSASQFYVNMQGVAAFSSGINQAVFELHLVNDGVRKPFNMKHSGELSSGSILLTTDGFYDNTAAITSLEITSTDTDINGGTLKLYGVR